MSGSARGRCVKRDERDEPVRVYVSTGATGGRRGSQLLDGSVQAGAVSTAESKLYRVLESPHRAAHADRDQLSASRVPRMPRRPQEAETVVRLVQGLRQVRGERAAADTPAVLQEAMRVSNQHRDLSHPPAVRDVREQRYHQRGTVHHRCHQPHGAHPGGRRLQGRVQEQRRPVQVRVQYLTVRLYQHHLHADPGKQHPDNRGDIAEYTWCVLLFTSCKSRN